MAQASELSEMIAAYRASPEYLKLGFSTRQNYESYLRRFERDFAGETVAAIDELRLSRAVEGWTVTGTKGAQAMLGALGRLAAFGWATSKVRDWRELQITVAQVACEHFGENVNGE